MSGNDEVFEMGESFNVRVNNAPLKHLAFKEEQRFISIILKHKDNLMDAMSYGLISGPEGHFWNPESRFMFGIISQYYNKYSQILTRTAIDSILESTSSLGGKPIDDEDRANAKMMYDKIYNMESSAFDYEMLRDNINNRFVQWRAYEVAKESLEKLVKASSGQKDIVKDIREKYIKLEGLDADPYSLIMNASEGMKEALKMINARRENPDIIESIMCGIQGIDNIFNGFDRGSYTVICGFINGGKSTMMFNMAFNMAKAGHNVVYVSIEKKAVPIYVRLLCLHALIDYNRTKIGGKTERGMSDYYWDKVTKAAQDIENRISQNFHVVQLAQGTKLSKVISDIEKVKILSGKKIDVVVVDYLGVIGNETVTPGRPDLDEAKTSQRLQAYGRINNFVTITGSQLKTQSAKEIRGKSKKATAGDVSEIDVNTEDLSGSKIVPADADNVISCILNSDQPPTKMYANITKARDAEAKKTAILDFDGKLGRVSDPDIFGSSKDVDDIIYNNAISDEEIIGGNCLFDSADKIKKEVLPNESVTKKEESIAETANNESQTIIQEKNEVTLKLEEAIENTKKKNKDKNKEVDLFEDIL